MEEKKTCELSLDEMDKVSGGTGNGTALNGENAGSEGVVTESLSGSTFRVALDNGQTVTAGISGKLRMNYTRILVGDRVLVEGEQITRVYR